MGNWKTIALDLAASAKRATANWTMFRRDNKSIMEADPVLDAKVEAHVKSGEDLATYLRGRLEGQGIK